jgi:FLVCR family MFS transporter 7
MKVSMAAAVIFGLIFLQLTMISNIMYFILVCGFLFGVMGLAMYPVGLEMSAECTFPVTETTSTGFVVLSGQIQGFIFLMIMNYFAKPLSKEQAKIQVCDPKDPSMAKDMRNSIYVRF